MPTASPPPADRLRARLVNLFVQSAAAGGLLVAFPVAAADVLTGPLLAAVALQFAAIALYDVFEDECTCATLRLVGRGLLAAALVLMLALGLFADPHLRLHMTVLIVGNALGGKVDSPTWKAAAVVYLLLLAAFEARDLTLVQAGLPAAVYAAAAAALVGWCERVSERDQRAWLVHTAAAGAWALADGPFAAEGLLFLVGSVAYELVKTSALLTRRFATPVQAVPADPSAFHRARPAG